MKEPQDEELSGFLENIKRKPPIDYAACSAYIEQLNKLLDRANLLKSSKLLIDCHIKLLTLYDNLISKENVATLLPKHLPVYLHSIGYLQHCKSPDFIMFSDSFITLLKKLDNDETRQQKLLENIDGFYQHRKTITYFPTDDHFQNLFLGKIGKWIGRFPAYKKLQAIRSFPYTDSMRLSADSFLDEMLNPTSDTELLKNNVLAVIDYCKLQRSRIEPAAEKALEFTLLRILFNAANNPYPMFIFELTQRFQKNLDTNSFEHLTTLISELSQRNEFISVAGYLVEHFNLRHNNNFTDCIKAYDSAPKPKSHEDLIQDLKQRYLVYLVTSDNNVPNDKKIALLSQNFDQLRGEIAQLRTQLENKSVANMTLGINAQRFSQSAIENSEETASLDNK